jgi:bifunctional DNA-binding transcriptional regulator/antitoxin component of YhaV-PrlF toxin-antitoxin module
MEFSNVGVDRLSVYVRTVGAGTISSLDTMHFSAIIKSGACMNTVTLTSDYQMNFPKEIFESAGFKAGTSFEVITYDNMVQLVPIKRIKSLRGMLKGMDTTFEREEEDRL